MSPRDGEFRCSDRARLRADPLTGTAPPARRWLLIEHPQNWPPGGFPDTAIEESVRRDVQTAADQASARVLLIRRPGRAGQPDPDRARARRWCVVEPAGLEQVTWGTWGEDRDLLRAAAQLRALNPQPSQPVAGPDVGVSEPSVPPVPATAPQLLLVCTHGRKDICCAVRGRPVAAVLAEDWPEATWECSHVGGDRFAANLIVLPDGACYGGLDPVSAVDVVSAHGSGDTDAAYLRGVTGQPPAMQAAMIAAYRDLSPLPWSAVRAGAVVAAGEGRWSAQVTVQGHGQFTGLIAEDIRDPHQLTCFNAVPHRATVPVVVSLTRSEGEPA